MNKNYFKSPYELIPVPDEQRRIYQIAEVSLVFESDLPLQEDTLNPKFKLFEIPEIREDNLIIRHHFYLPEFGDKNFGTEVYRKLPWAVFQQENHWLYFCTGSSSSLSDTVQLIVYATDYSWGRIFNKSEEFLRHTNRHALTFLPTDQLYLSQALAFLGGFFIHSSGVIFGGKGLVFAGHSGAGKSTIVKLIKSDCEILCDDRIIIRDHQAGFRIHGNWSHGEIPLVSPKSAPFTALFFLEKSDENRIIPLHDSKLMVNYLLSYLIKPIDTADWWEMTLPLIEKVCRDIPAYTLRFDKSGAILNLLRSFVDEDHE